MLLSLQQGYILMNCELKRHLIYLTYQTASLNRIAHSGIWSYLLVIRRLTELSLTMLPSI